MTQRPLRNGRLPHGNLRLYPDVLMPSLDDLASSHDDETPSTGTETQPPPHSSMEDVFFGSQKRIGSRATNPCYIAKVAAKVCAGIVKAWRLDDSDAEKMLAIDSSAWVRIKNEKWNGLFDEEQLMRISAVIALYKALHSCFNNDLADRWIKRPNTGSIFSGRKPIDIMIEGGLPAMLKTRRYLIAG